MTTHGSFARRSVSSPAVISTSVMAGLSCSLVYSSWVAVGGRTEKSSLLNSVAGQHLAKLLGGGRDDRDEIGFAQPALGAMALQIAARAAMEHRRMRGRATGVAKPQSKRDDATPITVVGIVGIARQRHRLLLELRMQFAKLNGLLRQIAIDMAKRRVNLV